MPATAAPARYMQGVTVPAESVNPAEFFRRTRREIRQEKAFPYTGQATQTVELLKSGILSTILIRFSGQIVTTKGAGTVNPGARWPYDLLKAVRFSANGASNLINCSGLKLKARDVMKKSDLTDRGVAQTFGGSTRTQGTLSRASESWGIGANTTNVADGTYPVELEWVVPVAEDEIDLSGAIFLATSSTDLTLDLDLATPAELFGLTGNATAVLTGDFSVSTTKFSIPIGDDGNIVVPDLSLFHSIIQTRAANSLAQGENEVRLVGQGPGKSLLRVFYQLFNGATPVPLAQSKANFGRQAFRYGSNESPDEFIDGAHMRVDMERRYNADIGALWGFGCHDFAHENTFRDVLDLGTTSDLRLVINANTALTNPALEYVQETVYVAGQSV